MGNKNNNIIEINGQPYDAASGAALKHGEGAVKPSRRNLDGVMAPPAHQAHPEVAVTKAKPVQKPAMHDVVRRTAKAPSTNQPQHSHTLMRHTVKKPAASFKRHLKAQTHTGVLVKQPKLGLTPKQSAQRLDAQRLEHAQHVSKSKLVSRFNPNQPAGPLSARPTSVKPAPATQHTVSNHPKPKTTADVLQHAIHQATSHQQKPPKKRRSTSQRIGSISALVLAVTILAGVVAFQNLPSIKVRFASSKAGFSASLPGYQPAGYSLSHLNYSPGLVALHYKSNSDNRSFALTEKTSEWDSDTLRSSVLASSGNDYQAVESAGRIVYLYGKNNATWVSSGVWYQLQSSGALSNRQLVDIAKSL